MGPQGMGSNGASNPAAVVVQGLGSAGSSGGNAGWMRQNASSVQPCAGVDRHMVKEAHAPLGLTASHGSNGSVHVAPGAHLSNGSVHLAPGQSSTYQPGGVVR